MAKKFIKAADVRKGDSIKVRFTVEDTTITREGIVDHIQEVLSGGHQFRTAKGYSLGPTAQDGCTIQLLDRPKPEPLVPSRDGAVVKYIVDFDEHFPVRTAVRSKSGEWPCYNDKGEEQDKHFSDKDFIDFLTESSFTPEVLFAGVTK